MGVGACKNRQEEFWHTGLSKGRPDGANDFPGALGRTEFATPPFFLVMGANMIVLEGPDWATGEEFSARTAVGISCSSLNPR
jgi:hypothetical protein